ncbi:glycoside hydrolase family 16 protein [Paenibacillus lignilyticus]|uniref:Family 16 glycosylhydrolase n=1 Tax=Paenibacillus lignilyticus TaxID=1172615 RepID=A0ABS5C9V8_9BACL|nr:family 16 glycosylhydrolase [Paenibacillus lignilyticus]MBP3962784.1 family 16 glycosylhydrolase [Paenibacillus lignilyticus]
MGGISNGGISSGQIVTKETFYPRDGKTYIFQLRAKIPTGAGTWPAFWMYSPGGAGSTTSEIDIFEYFNSPTQNTYDWTGFDHGDGVGTDYYSIMTNQWVWHPGFDFAADFAATFHTYTLIWKEGNIQKWVDNTLVKGTNFAWYGPDPEVLINLAVGGTRTLCRPQVQHRSHLNLRSIISVSM